MNRILDRAASVKLVVFDIDGVMTDGDITFLGNGEESKTFNVHDGFGLTMLKEAGCNVAVISARSSKIVSRRMAELGIDCIYQGQTDKKAALCMILGDLNINSKNAAYVGDDLGDLPAMQHAGISIAVANAHPFVRKHADWVTEKPGGHGAVREICELILKAQDKLDPIYNRYLQ